MSSQNVFTSKNDQHYFQQNLSSPTSTSYAQMPQNSNNEMHFQQEHFDHYNKGNFKLKKMLLLRLP